jgi:thiol-disulfide isomerase/thioredoxin
MANERFLPANQAAVQLAGEDGVLSMKDLYQADAKAIMIFVSASWCPYCGTEANQLDDLYQSYKDDERGKVLFLGVLSQDSGGNPATVSEAEMYASSRGWTFPAVPDVNYVTEQYFLTPAYPFHIFIDGRTMTIEKSLHAALTTSDLSSHIEDLLNN